MLDLLQILGEPERGLALTLFLAGTALILVNLTTHNLLDYFRTRRRRRELVVRNLKPLLRASADLISRLTEILITRKASMVEAVTHYERTALATRVNSLSVATMNRHESTAYRLVNFLALANAFTRRTAALPPFALLDRVEYFIQHKIAVGLRGNLYNMNWLSTELQEDLGASYLDCDKHRRPAELSVSHFISFLKRGTDGYDPVLFERALEFVGLVSPFPGVSEQINRESPEWKHTLVLAHLAVYLIDFYQELGNDPQWEEHRVFFVKMIRQWNADGTKHRYLYEPGDLDGSDYVGTFPAKRTSRQSSFSIVPSVLGLRTWVSRTAHVIRLNLRGSRYGRRHHPKRVYAWGVRIRSRERQYDINWTYDLRSVHAGVKGYLADRLLEM